MARDFSRFLREVKIKQELPRELRDLVGFAAWLEERFGFAIPATDLQIADAADDFWDNQHGDD